MQNFIQYLILILFIFLIALPIDSQELPQKAIQPSTMISVESSKKELKDIYFQSGQNKTLHCGCMFDQQLQVHSKTCKHLTKNPSTKIQSSTVKWVHAMPMEKFAGSLRCWKNPSCTFSDGKIKKAFQCCKEISPKFKSMQADMHNLFPSVMTEKEGEYDSAMPPYGGNQEYAFCGLNKRSLQGPRQGVRGDIARAWFYMAWLYKLSIANDFEDQLRAWHLEDPPDAWEQERNNFIETTQGNRNIFVDFPESVERVKDF